MNETLRTNFLEAWTTLKENLLQAISELKAKSIDNYPWEPEVDKWIIGKIMIRPPTAGKGSYADFTSWANLDIVVNSPLPSWDNYVASNYRGADPSKVDAYIELYKVRWRKDCFESTFQYSKTIGN